MKNAFVNTIFELAKLDKNMILITGDLGFGNLTKFCETYPSQFINAGICEQNMTSVAAGMALEGKTVFTYSIANFSTMRCLEQIRNDIAYHCANVKIVAVGGGFSYGASGMSHHATEDIAIMRALPEMTIFTPCDPFETIQVTRIATSMQGPCYIRLGRGGESSLHQSQPAIALGKAVPLVHGEDTAILVAGAIADEALAAAVILQEKQISCAVYSFPTVKPLDKELIWRLCQKHSHLYSLEEHNIVGGFGGAVAEVITERTSSVVLHRLGLQDVYTSVVGSQEWLRSYYRISGNKVAQAIMETYAR